MSNEPKKIIFNNYPLCVYRDKNGKFIAISDIYYTS